MHAGVARAGAGRAGSDSGPGCAAGRPGPPARVIQRDADHLRAVRALAGGEAVQLGHLLDARAAPAGPQVDQHRPAGVVRRAARRGVPSSAGSADRRERPRRVRATARSGRRRRRAGVHDRLQRALADLGAQQRAGAVEPAARRRRRARRRPPRPAGPCVGRTHAISAPALPGAFDERARPPRSRTGAARGARCRRRKNSVAGGPMMPSASSAPGRCRRWR